MLGYLRNLLAAIRPESVYAMFSRVCAVFLCLTIHETCHGLAACVLGDPTAQKQHRISLNPLRHIDWFGLLMMFTVGFGWAKPVPVDPRYFKRPKEGMALTALAGPVSNFVLAALAMLLVRLTLGIFPDSFLRNGLYTFLLHELAPLSLGLGLFNLLPVPPLDGAKVLGAVIPERLYFTLMRYERWGMLLLLAMSLTGAVSGLISGGIISLYELFFRFFFR